MRSALILAAGLALLALTGCGSSRSGAVPAQSTIAQAGLQGVAAAQRGVPLPTFMNLGDAAVQTLEKQFYTGSGSWNLCINGGGCGATDQDWGADSLIYSLWLHWTTTHGGSVPPIMRAVTANATQYTSGTNSWSDVPMWDSIAGAREYQVTGDAQALTNAKNAFDYVDSDPHGNAFAAGFCPGIHYQLPHAGGGGLKTLETDSNYIKAAILLYQITGTASYLTKAENEYAAVRSQFLEPDSPLYTVYVWDNGSSCLRVRNQFFASVNGNMIWSGWELNKITGLASYKNDAVASEQYVISHLSDATGVFESLLQENDSSEEMVEAMWTLANDGDSAARNWILTNMSAAASSIAASGAYSRFFGSIAPQAKTSAWASAGGISLAFAASALNPSGTPATTTYWSTAQLVNGPFPAVTNTPWSLTFTGRAISIMGTLAQHAGHIEVSIDGTETVNDVGIDQGYGTAGKIPNTVLFAWRWPTSGQHTITFSPPEGNEQNIKQGNAWFQMSSYYFVP